MGFKLKCTNLFLISAMSFLANVASYNAWGVESAAPCIEQGLSSQLHLQYQSPPKKVVILGASFGGGHASSGSAIVASLLKQDPRTKIKYVDLMKYGRPAITRLAKYAYWQLQKISPRVYDFFYKKGVKKENLAGNFFRLNALATDLASASADVVLANSATGGKILSILKSTHREPKHAKLVWYHSNYFVNDMPEVSKNLDKTFLLSTQLEDAWLAADVDPRLVEVSGPNIYEGYFQPLDRKQFFFVQRLKVDKKLVVITGGAEGAIDYSKVIASLQGSLHEPLQIVAVTGDNSAARAELNKLKTLLPENIELRVLPKIPKEDLSLWVRAADLYITKGGGNSAPEAFVAGVPVIVVDSVRGHETVNAQFFSDAGLALVNQDANQVGPQALQIFQDSRLRSDLRRNQESFREGLDPEAIARYILNPFQPAGK